MSKSTEELGVGEEPNGEPTCEIFFKNSSSRVYYAGQTVNGSFNLTINEAITVRAIYANIIGRGYCKWTTGSSSRSSKTHMKEEFYFNRKIYYVGRQNTSERVTIQPGEYQYSFNCDIPDDCHTSVEEDTGFIRYSVVVIIEEDNDLKKEFVESFTVINELNLNEDETYSYPMKDETVVTYSKYCCLLCCWETEPVKISARVPMKGYAPGQAIEITIVVDNKSDQTYDSFIGNIYKKVEFYADGRTKSSKDLLTTAKCEGCSAGESISRKLIIPVPPTPRTEASSICSISYELTVGAFSDCCRDDPSIEFPLTIGSYPIQKINTETSGIVVTRQPNTETLSEEIVNQPSHSRPLLCKENLSSEQFSQQSSVDKSKIDLPDFEVGETNLSDKDLENRYRPLYPVYDNNQYPLSCELKVKAIKVKPIKM